MNKPIPLELRLTQKAEKDLLGIPLEFRQRVKSDIFLLSEGKLPLGQLKKLRGFHPSVWQMTAGRFRVLYRRESEVLFILRVIAKPDQDRTFRGFH